MVNCVVVSTASLFESIKKTYADAGTTLFYADRAIHYFIIQQRPGKRRLNEYAHALVQTVFGPVENPVAEKVIG